MELQVAYKAIVVNVIKALTAVSLPVPLVAK
jgi:hypothetical protein